MLRIHAARSKFSGWPDPRFARSSDFSASARIEAELCRPDQVEKGIPASRLTRERGRRRRFCSRASCSATLCCWWVSAHWRHRCASSRQANLSCSPLAPLAIFSHSAANLINLFVASIAWAVLFSLSSKRSSSSLGSMTAHCYNDL
jgi:hypothetical protein